MTNRKLRRSTTKKSEKTRRRVVSAPQEKHVAAEDDIPQRSNWRSRSVLFAKFFGGVALALSLGAGLSWGAWRYALATPRFAVQNIEVEGVSRFHQDDILGLADLRRGRNLLTIDPSEAEFALVANPWIQRAYVSRRLPDTLKVVVEEHEPVALLQLGSEILIVDRDARPFKTWAMGDPADLPFLTGVQLEALQRDRGAEMHRLRQGLSLLIDYSKLGMAKKYSVQELHFEESGAVTLIAGESGLSFRLGESPWKEKLQRAAKVLRQTEKAGAAAETLFLDNQAHPERVVLRTR
ncbi:MAG: FtsQ-type POTRA domain-containing protein [Polyangiaceae bacterium]|nr:FtsQ-type POTRA domain-containing protein [Polyangiaceae bacterium]